MSTLATQSKGLLDIPNREPSVEQLLRLAMPPCTEVRSPLGTEMAAVKNPAGGAYDCRLSELEQTLAGVSPAIAAIRQLILEVAPTRASVMLYGESGTGKEIIAQAIHRYSKHFNGPFVPVNMAAISPGTADSLLFG